jgi:inosine-uridine nucleoside N-ribohydrolase
VSIFPKKIIIDTDLSLGEFGKDVDDGLALIMALNSPELEVVAISGVYGNTKLKNVSKNVPYLLSLFPERKNLPKYIEGAASYQDWRYKSDLLGTRLMAKIIREYAPITLVPIGPLTNIALLFHYYPEVLEMIDQIVIMGGCLNKWEFNFANDPAATEFVLNLPIKKAICGFETCKAQKFTDHHYQILKVRHSARSEYIVHGIRSWLQIRKLFSKNGHEKGFYPYDSTAIAYLIRPDIFQSENIPVNHTNTEKQKIRIFDFSSITQIDQKRLDQKDHLTLQEKKSWVDWTMKIDSKIFMDLLMERLH